MDIFHQKTLTTIYLQALKKYRPKTNVKFLAEKQRDREIERQRNRETEKQRDREIERQRNRERQRDRETKRQKDRNKCIAYFLHL